VYGFLYLMVIKPIFIICISLIYLAVFLTAWMWIPLLLLAHYLFSLFIYNMDHDYLKDE
jgi:hypothetical protein